MLKIDLRSDTVTQPTDEMRAAMAIAPVGDDVYGEDPTINELEHYAAAVIGKEAALFVPSGTMGNQIALLTHTRRGDEVVCDKDAHIFFYENAGAAALAGCQLRTLEHCDGQINPLDFEEAIRKVDMHMPRTSLLWIENSHNRGGGTCYSMAQLDELAAVAQKHNIRIHCDGARIFNAAAYLKLDASVLAAHCDSVMFCLSKGLCAPVGSILAGSAEFISRARQMRKLLGGGMRQAGILAAAGIIALGKMSARLAIDHANAKIVADKLAANGVFINLAKVQTNILLFDPRPFYATADECVDALRAHGVLASAFSKTAVRFVLHNDINDQQVDAVLAVIDELFKKE
ncbi:MAG: GntG family PLP-dependent aldolase [Negativicutes bacterium]